MICTVKYQYGNTVFAINNGKKFGKSLYILFYNVNIYEDIITYIQNLSEKDIDMLLIKYPSINVIKDNYNQLLDIIIENNY